MSTPELWKAIQEHVGAKPDGVPGPKTARAIYDALKLGGVPPESFTRSVVDIFHGDAPIDIAKMGANGVNALICKATQGLAFKDSAFDGFRKAAKDHGMLFGSYHFADSSDVAAQVSHYLSVASPESGDLVCLDWEPNQGSQMTRSQARQFVQQIHDRLGFWPVLYGGSLIKESVPSGGDEILNKCPLWLAQYGSTAALPNGWEKYTLWQYTGDGQGTMLPKTFPGASGPLDCSQFDGSEAELRAAWPFRVP